MASLSLKSPLCSNHFDLTGCLLHTFNIKSKFFFLDPGPPLVESGESSGG